MTSRISGWMVCALLVVTLLATGCNRGGGAEQPAVQPSRPTAPSAASSPSPSPSPEGEVYTVESGDTLSEIAQRYDTTVEAIVEANDIDDPDTLDVGDELRIPPDG